MALDDVGRNISGSSIDRITDEELYAASNADMAAMMVIGGDVSFSDACQTYGRERIISLIYANQKAQSGGSAQAFCEIHKSYLFYKSSS